MPQSLSLASVVEANRISSDVPFLVLIDLEIVNPTTGVVEMVRHIARNPETVEFNGNVYDAGWFDVSIKTEASRVAEVSLTVRDYDQSLMSYMEQYGGGVGSNVTLYVVNAGNLGQAPEIQEFFQIISASSSEYTHSFALGAENVLLQTFPRRRQTKDFCQWRYKDESTCRYSGPLASCDLTLQGPNGCGAHDNSINFGGQPGINSNGLRYG